jgi:hypothetical protein
MVTMVQDQEILGDKLEREVEQLKSENAYVYELFGGLLMI